MNNSIPLAEYLRPKTLDEVVGQDHLVGTNGIIRKLIDSKFLPSMILWGPPGVGKTSLAGLLATLIHAHFESKSAVTSNLSEIRSLIQEAQTRLQKESKKTVLFIDEIHRFNKAQQDALLPAVEAGTIIFIGATTENPSFEVISPLLSRTRVFVLQQLNNTELNILIDRGLILLKFSLDKEARDTLIEFSNGDGRQLLTILEISSQISTSKKTIKKSDIEEAAQKKMLQYDTKGEEHYNTISAFIKSMRASQIDATLYYLARMVTAGEDPLFIARRMIIFASEDIGLAQPTAQVVANSVFEACHKVGYPEAQIILAFGATYLAQAKKDRTAYDAYFQAVEDVQKHGNLPIPLQVRNAPTKLMKDLNYGKGYHIYTDESFLPEQLKNRTYYKKDSTK